MLMDIWESLFKGFASMLDIFGTQHPKLEDFDEKLGDFNADADALRSDFEKIIGKW